MKNLIGLLCLAGILGSFTSCATVNPNSTKSQVKHDRSQMSPMISKNEMIARISHALDKIPNLTKEQKQAVHDIHAEVLTQSWDINHKIRQNKILLFNYLGESKYNAKKVNYVKKEVEKLYKKKLKIMIASFNKLKKILGKDTSKILRQHDFMRTHGVNLKEF